MKTSWNEIQLIEKYLLGHLSTDKKILFEQRMSDSPMLRVNVDVQRKVYDLLRLYNRWKIRADVERVHERVFTDPAKAPFTESILLLFKR